MNKKGQHIDKYLSAKLPEPDVTADDAWKAMNDMLEQTSTPDIANTQEQPKTETDFIKIIVSLAILISIVLILWLLFFSNSAETNLPVQNKKQPEISDHSSKGPLSAIKSDSQMKQDSLLSNKANLENSKSAQTIRLAKSALIDSVDRNSNIVAKEQNHLNSYEPSGTLSRTADSPSDSSPKSAIRDIESSSVFHKARPIHRKTKPASQDTRLSDSENSYIPAHVTNRDINSSQAQNPQPDPGPRLLSLSIEALQPLPFRIHPEPGRMVYKPVKKPDSGGRNLYQSKKNSSFLKNLNFGPELSIGSAFHNTKHAFANVDGASNSYLTMIPGLWVRYNIGSKHAITMNVIPFQSYLGGLKNVSTLKELSIDSLPIRDSIPRRDSIVRYRNIKLIKATGLNIAFQYNYHITSRILVATGLSFTPFRNALLNETLSDQSGAIISDTLRAIIRGRMSQYLKTNHFTIKTGVIFSPRNYEFGFNLLVPFSNMSTVPGTSLKPLNGQVFFRWKLK